MNIKEAKQEITDTLRAYLAKDELGNFLIPTLRQRPILLMGPPGIGKTQIMEQIAAEIGVGLISYTITHHTRQSAVGLPYIEKKIFSGEEYHVTEYTMSEILASVYTLMEKTGVREGILFLDEINCVSETLAPMMLKFLQYKAFGNENLPEGWVVVAAGNPPEYNRSVRDFDVVTLDRVKLMNISEDFGVWKEYALKKGLHPAVISYLDIKKQHFYRIETSADGLQFATARGWEDLSEILIAYEKLQMTAGLRVIEQYIRVPAIARDFAAYLELYHKYQRTYHVEDILTGTWQKITMLELREAPFDEKYSVMSLMVSRLSDAAREVRQQDILAERLYESLSRLREMVDTEDAAEALNEIALEKRASLRKEREAGRLEKEARDLMQREIIILEEYRRRLINEDISSHEEAFDLVRGYFKAETEKLSELSINAGQRFDHAFSFLEETFGEGQEIVLFVTEITAGYDTSWYVEHYGCDAYFRHNRELLFDDENRRIREEIAAAKAALK